jgi:hypothetical protein
LICGWGTSHRATTTFFKSNSSLAPLMIAAGAKSTIPFKPPKVAQNVAMTKWTACLPGRLSTDDAMWFQNWKNEYPDIAIDLYDGDNLLELLRLPGAGAARQELQKHGVSGIPVGGVALSPILFTNTVQAAKTRSRGHFVSSNFER